MSEHRIYNDDKIKSIIGEYGYNLIKFNTTTDIIASDCDGYKYSLTLSNLKVGRIPNRLMMNPYAIENIKNYLSIHCPDYELLDREYLNSKKKMRFICHKHADKGIQYNSAANIMNNHHYCKYCSYERMRDDRVLPVDKLIELCNERNVTYVGRYTSEHESQIQYTCDKHKDKGIQAMSLTHFKASDVPCKYCNISKGELRIMQFLDNHNIEFEQEKMFKDCVYKRPLRFDFYLPKQNVIIEYDGKQHFEPVTFWSGEDAKKQLEINQTRDKIKTQYCIDNNIKLIRISYKEYDSIDNVLSFLI